MGCERQPTIYGVLLARPADGPSFAKLVARCIWRFTQFSRAHEAD